MLSYNVDWRVEGSSTVEVEEFEIPDSILNQIDEFSDREFLVLLDEYFKGDLLRDAVDYFSERDRPILLEAIREDF